MGAASEALDNDKAEDGAAVLPPLRAPRRSGAAAVPPVLVYCLCSMAMIFTNKLVLSTFEFEYAATLLVIQSAVAVISLKALSFAGVRSDHACASNRYTYSQRKRVNGREGVNPSDENRNRTGARVSKESLSEPATCNSFRCVGISSPLAVSFRFDRW